MSTFHNFCSSKPFSCTDITSAIDNLKPGKSAGADSISNEFYIMGSFTSLVNVLLLFFNSILYTGYLPEDFNLSILIPIQKKRKSQNPRTIGLFLYPRVSQRYLKHLYLI